MKTLMIILPMASLLTAARPNQNELQPIAVPTDGIVYPLPSIGLPQIPAGQYTETQESPTLHYSRTIKRLAEAQKLEQSAQTKQLHAAWQDMLRKQGPDSMETSRAYAAFLSQYSVDLKKAVRVYDEVGHALEGMQASDGQPDQSEQESITGDLEELVRSEDLSRSYTDAACLVDPESCVPPDPDNQRIVTEISSLITMLDTGGPTGELRPEVLQKKASLLKRRAQLVMLLTRRAAQNLALRVAAPKDADGNLRKMVVPVQATKASKDRAKHYRPADPYRD